MKNHQMKAVFLGIAFVYITFNMLGFPIMWGPHIGWAWSFIMLLINAVIMVSVLRKL